MAAYELIYIINPEVSDEELPQVIEKMSQSVANAGGNVVEVAQWGRKRMAYPIRRFAEGNYVFNRIELEPVKVKEIEANLRLSDEVLRHLVVKTRA
ncbi:MAG: 30S ribosomal protein S6 [Dehalococcoidia bacterium]